MKFSPPLTLLLFLLALTVLSCDQDDEEDITLEDCAQGTLEGMRCALSSTVWQLASVRSNRERGRPPSASSDWLTFQPECYSSSQIMMGGFAAATDTSYINIWKLGEVGNSCSDLVVFDLETNDYMETARVGYARPFSLFMFGDSLSASTVDETWYDIDYSSDAFTFSVDKTLDSVVYRVDVEMVRVR